MRGDLTKHTGRILILLLIFSVRIFAEENEDLRVRAGVDLFPSFLAADTDLSQKKDSDGFLFLLVVYKDNPKEAEEIAAQLKKIEKIRDMPIRIELAADDSLKIDSDQTVAGIFMAQPIHYGLELLIRFAENRHVILFSPFHGDVERGVTGGLVVKEKILPYINEKALKSAGIRMKEFFLRVSEKYNR